MTEREKVKAAERLVQDVLSVDLHQNVSHEVVQNIALKVSKAIPNFQQQPQREKQKGVHS